MVGEAYQQKGILVSWVISRTWSPQVLHCLSPHPYRCLTRPRNCVVTSDCAGPAIVIKGLSMFPLERQFSEGMWVVFFFSFFLGYKGARAEHAHCACETGLGVVMRVLMFRCNIQ